MNFNILDIRYELKLGEISPITIISPKDIEYIDTKETEEKIEEEKKKIIPVFDIDMNIYEDKISILEKIFEISNDKIEEKEERIKELLSKLIKERNIENISFADIIKFFKKKSILEKTKSLLFELYKGGIYKPSEGFNIENYYNNPVPARIIEGNEIKNDYIRINNFIYGNTSYFDILKIVIERIGKKEYTKTITDIIYLLIEENLTINTYITQQETKNRLNRIKPVKKVIKENEVVIRKGDKVNQEHKDQLKAIKFYKSKGTITKGLFTLIMSIIITIIFVILILIFLKDYINKKSKISAIYFFPFINIFIVYIIQNIFSNLSFPLGILFPISITCFMLLLLVDEKAAIINTIITSLIYLTFIIIYKSDTPYSILLIIFPSFLLIKISKNISSREQIIKQSFFLAILYLILILIYDLYFTNYIEKEEKIVALISSVLNPLLSSIFAIGLLPFFEKIFNIVTPFKLMELSSLNNPILKDMQILAPGTYHHSLFVSTLVEAACKEIGANSLLGRVGALYHDIGKIYMAEYFAENKDYTKINKEASPGVYTIIIRNHVIKGIQFGKNVKLPDEIIRFIIEHHGKSLIEFFYYKALEIAEKNNESINENDFRHIGINPRTKETAILMLADSVEAAVRSLNTRRYEVIKDKIHEIVRKKINEGLLDDAPLTLKDTLKITNVFEKMILSYYHIRPSYQNEKEENNEY
ncbi:MAG TPA: HDIG domain-containing protein [Spirochaetota bacterium]|nr:HDIG domain-containing protein [Spirochaetota bacterium]HOM38175.1 HDIG domain-containing protein [Spirochaetota bacterium]